MSVERRAKHERVVGLISKMVYQNFLEFVLLKEQVDAKFTLVEKSVNFLFDVHLTREEEDSKRCWVKVEGDEDDIKRAKVRSETFEMLGFSILPCFLYFDLLC